MARARAPGFPGPRESLHAQATGQVIWTQFADHGRWSLTEADKGAGEHLPRNSTPRELRRLWSDVKT
ncbi:MAG: hypothetical protein NVS3B6_22040 [Pseudarthrobacter sp.]